MNILAPLNDVDYLVPFIEAGADEFFFGFYEDRDRETFGRYFELNRMSGFARDASRFSLSDAIALTQEIKRRGKDVYITLNSAGYTQDHLLYMESYVRQLVAAGADGFIVSCPEAVDLVHQMGGQSVVSCVASVYNSAMAKFYKDLGAKRIIVPRDLSMEELQSLTNHVPGMEFESFIMRNGCLLSDGNCMGLHLHKHGGICKSLQKSEKRYILNCPQDLPDVEEMQKQYDTCLYRTACGLCAIYRMLQANITACKVVGRLDWHDQVLKDIRLVHENIEIAKNSDSEAAFFAHMHLTPDCTRKNHTGYSCYFPEVVNPCI